jgi:hypothetical protein
MGIYFHYVEAHTAFKLNFEESINKRHSFGLCCVSKSLYRANIITKYQIVFLTKKKFFEFILAMARETYLSILVEKFPPF